MSKRPSAFVLSLDFELFWGLKDCVSLEHYRHNLLGVREAIPALLELFRERDIRATWATVGFLFCRTKLELEAAMPSRLPSYRDGALSPYDLSDVGEDEARDPFHFAPSLVEAIARTPGQEVASHTFSHFYCLEGGQTEEDFDADLKSARCTAHRLGIDLRSLVFPRNQENPAYRACLIRNGIRAYRPAARGWPYRPTTSSEPPLKRLARFVDAYAPLTGSRSLPLPAAQGDGLVAVAASSFLRPYSAKLQHADALLLYRITSSMEQAAQRGELYHLWWHPHNFGVNLRENLGRLSKILDKYRELSRKYGMESRSMIDFAAG